LTAERKTIVANRRRRRENMRRKTGFRAVRTRVKIGKITA